MNELDLRARKLPCALISCLRRRESRHRPRPILRSMSGLLRFRSLRDDVLRGLRERWTNPALDVEIHAEQPRERFLPPEEMTRLGEALERARGVDYDAVRRFIVSDIDQRDVVTSTRLASRRARPSA